MHLRLLFELHALTVEQPRERVVVRLASKLYQSCVSQPFKQVQEIGVVSLNLVQECARKTVGYAKGFFVIRESLYQLEKESRGRVVALLGDLVKDELV